MNRRLGFAPRSSPVAFLAGAACLLCAVALPATATADTKEITVALTDAIDGAEPNPAASQWGRVTSSPAGIACPGDCVESFERGTVVRLEVQAAPGYELGRWSVFGNDAGPGCDDAATTCTLTIGADGAAAASVEAALRPQTQLLVTPEGAGTARIEPPEAGRVATTCVVPIPVYDPLPAECAPRYPRGRSVTVRAAPDPAVAGARLQRWSDWRCGSRPTCRVTMTADTVLTAIFTPLYLTVTPGTFGAVTLPPPGGMCTFMPDVVTEVGPPCTYPGPGGVCAFADTDPPCRMLYPAGTVVTVGRDPANATDPSHRWRGSCAGLGPCRVTMRKNEVVRAGVEPGPDVPTPVGLGIALEVTGARGLLRMRALSGAQRSVTCMRACARTGYSRGESVRITAVNTRRAAFVRWADIASRSRTRTVYIGERTPIRAIFRRR